MTPNRFRLGCALVAAWIFLVSCGGTSDGIDGTGSPISILSYGHVSGFGSVEVNGVHYDTSSASFLIDGTAGSGADLGLGDIVFVAGQLAPRATRGTAQQVVSNHVLQGEVQSVAADAASMVALGQTVRVDQHTVLGLGLEAGITALAPGDLVSVSGFRNDAGDVLATRIARQAGGTANFKTTGAVTSVDSSGQRLQINGLTVDYSAAQLLPADAANALAPGVFVEVKAATFTDGQVFRATSVEITRQRFAGAADAGADVEGYITSLDSNGGTFHIDGLPIVATGATDGIGTLATGTRLQVKGALNTSGQVVAGQIRTFPFSIPPNDGQLVGHVFDAASGPVSDAVVGIFVGLPNGGYSYTYATGTLPKTDANGAFSVPVPTGVSLTVFVTKPGFVQPCAVVVQTNTVTSVDVELVAQSTLDASNPPPPQSAAGAITTTGTVYELVAGNRQPIAGALVWFTVILDIPVATTVSDRDGHYLACNLPSAGLSPNGVALTAQEPGFVDAEVDGIDTSRSTVVDVEMKRR